MRNDVKVMGMEAESICSSNGGYGLILDSEAKMIAVWDHLKTISQDDGKMQIINWRENLMQGIKIKMGDLAKVSIKIGDTTI